MRYLLSGAEFNNKGAEAMTLVALKNIYAADKDASVYLLDQGKCPQFELTRKLEYIKIRDYQYERLLGVKDRHFNRSEFRDFIKLFIPGISSTFTSIRETEEILRSIDYVLDISGFSFSSKWGDLDTIDCMNRINLYLQYGAKVYLMPQSFGPFDYNDNKVLEYGLQTVAKCEMIYARESSGYQLLRDCGLTNVQYCPDSVLIEPPFDLSMLIRDMDSIMQYAPSQSVMNGVAIVPNARLFDNGKQDRDQVLTFYRKTIDILVDHDIYLIPHSGEDRSICADIKKMYENNDRVILISEVMNSFVFQQFVRDMAFIVSSRYHACVHAYKEGTPCIILGWADKYNGLAELFDQNKYLINVDKGFDEAINAVTCMNREYEQASMAIREKLSLVQTRYSCYKFLDHIRTRSNGNMMSAINYNV